MNETPYCFSLLFAESIARDSSGKWNLIGVYDLLTFEAFPVDVSVAVFFGVIDGRGVMPNWSMQTTCSRTSQSENLSARWKETLNCRTPCSPFKRPRRFQFGLTAPEPIT